MGCSPFHQIILNDISAIDGVEAGDSFFASSKSLSERQQGYEFPHGLHDLFYWQRSLGAGVWIKHSGAGLMVSHRADVNKLTIIRPCGDINSIAALVQVLTPILKKRWNGDIVIRYCSKPLANTLSSSQWIQLVSGWSEASALDDESFPQVELQLDGVTSSSGPNYRMLRQACYLHENNFKYLHTNLLIGLDEESFCLNSIPRSVVKNSSSRQEFVDFIRATFIALRTYEIMDLKYHYLLELDGKLSAFAITYVSAERGEIYLLLAENVKRLVTFFVANIAKQLFNEGALFFNLGGSEVFHLHQFKTFAFGPFKEYQTFCLGLRDDKA